MPDVNIASATVLYSLIPPRMGRPSTLKVFQEFQPITGVLLVRQSLDIVASAARCTSQGSILHMIRGFPGPGWVPPQLSFEIQSRLMASHAARARRLAPAVRAVCLQLKAARRESCRLMSLGLTLSYALQAVQKGLLGNGISAPASEPPAAQFIEWRYIRSQVGELQVIFTCPSALLPSVERLWSH